MRFGKPSVETRPLHVDRDEDLQAVLLLPGSGGREQEYHRQNADCPSHHYLLDVEIRLGPETPQ